MGKLKSNPKVKRVFNLEDKETLEKLKTVLSEFTDLRSFEIPISASFWFWIVLALAIPRLILLRKNLKGHNRNTKIYL